MQIIITKPTSEQINQTKNWGIWSKEPSEFTYKYDDQETCLILEGEAIVTEPDGIIAHFKAGDWVVFPAGLKCTWKIIKTIKKKYKFGL